MTRRDWICFAGLVLVGWRLAMTYPLSDDLPAILLSLAVGTLGVGIVGVACYVVGWQRGRES